MIEFTKAFKTSDGETHSTLESAQRHELVNIFLGQQLPETDQQKNDAEASADTVLENSDKIVDILTTKASSKPKARAINGGRKPRTPKPATSPAPAT